jgi:hypothetical protein
MTESSPISTNPVPQLITSWLQRQLVPGAMTWLQERLQHTKSGDKQTFFLTFGMIPRKTGKALLNLSDSDLQQAQKLRAGWNPKSWSIDQVARTLLVLSLPAKPVEAYQQILDQTFATGEVGELVALYQSLHLLPHPEAHRLRAAEGIRSNMKVVFAAVAHENPYPSEQLEEGPWNQLVLKCLFVGLPLDPVYGLDKRANPSLAKMLLDFAHERWAAKRTISPELWRVIGPFTDDVAIRDLRNVLENLSELEKQAAILTLIQSPHPEAPKLLAQYSDLHQRAKSGQFTWSTISRDWTLLQGS